MKPSAPSSQTTTSLIQSVRNACVLLESLRSLEEATLSQLARYTGFSMNQTFRLLATLEHEGYVHKSSNKRYRLGSTLHILGQAARWPHRLIDSATPVMDDLAQLSGETILLAIPTGLERMIVAQKSSRHSLQVHYPIGSRLPLYVGGMGIAMLSYLPHKQHDILAQPLQRFTEYSLDHAGLQAEFAKIKEEGVRVSIDDYSIGEFSIAAPILDKDGTAYAAITIAGFTARLVEGTLDRYKKAILEARHHIQKRYADTSP